MAETKSFDNNMLIPISYALVREAMQKTNSIPYHMSLAGDDRKAVLEVVNVGIDAHLEACFIPSLGDRYSDDGNRLMCQVSPESLPTLLRRLSEREIREDDESSGLADSILGTLGIDDYGKYVGREALGL